MRDARWRTWEVYCVGLSWMVPNVQERKRRAREFARKYFADAEHYIRNIARVSSVLNPSTRRHKRTDATILRSLEVTREELALFRCIGKGRSEPQESRADIEARTSARRNRAVLLRSEGYPLSEIGRRIGVTKQRVQQYLSESEVASSSPLYSGETAPLSFSSPPMSSFVASECLKSVRSDRRVLSSPSEARKCEKPPRSLEPDPAIFEGAPGEDLEACAGVVNPSFHPWVRVPNMAVHVA